MDDLMDIDETAAYIRTPAATLRYWRHQGVGPKSFKVGRRVMYRRTDLQAWLHAQYDAASRTAQLRDDKADRS